MFFAIVPVLNAIFVQKL